MVPELAIPTDELVDACIHKLTRRVRDAHTELEKVQLGLNLQITEFQLRAQPSTPPEVKEKRATAIIEAIAVVESAVVDYTMLFEQSFEVLTNLRESPTV